MWRALLLSTLCLSCGNDPDPAAPSGGPGPLHVVSGVVEDSMLNLPVAGIRVLIGDSVAVTDSQGRFTTVHRSGNFTILVDDYSYERYEVPLAIFSDDRPHVVRLRGFAPYLLSCTFETDLLTARVVDLQGRKTVDRRSQSAITLVSNETRFYREAYNWYWTPVDNLTWLAHVPHTGVVADTADWRLEDADGYVRGARCVNQPPPCTGC
jgi:hypothetical protein